MICVILLAAGQSRRMGSNKLLLPLDGKPVITLIVDELLRSPADQVMVVVNSESSPIRQALAGRLVHWTVNSDPSREMLVSIRCGLRALPPQAEAALVVLGDQPGLKAEIVARLIQTFRNFGHGLIVPAWQGKRGHPCLIARPYWDEILNSHAGQGMRGLLQAHAQEVCVLPVDTPNVLEDMDYPEDYQRLSARYQSGELK